MSRMTAEARHPHDSHQRRISERDPVCGMLVDPVTARGGSHTHQGRTYYFCNPKCRDRFVADPSKYIPAPPSLPSEMPAAATYVCPMDPEVRQGPCPTCGMALEPESPAPAVKTDWVCPMHPQIVWDAAGSC